MGSYDENTPYAMTKILNIIFVNRDIPLKDLSSRMDVDETLLQNILNFLKEFEFIACDENAVHLSEPVREFFDSHYLSS